MNKIRFTPANGTRGTLIRLYDGKYVFRVYKDDDFTDYDILHYDLSIVIDDEDAYFYRGDSWTYLDHSPETLGIKDDLGNS